MSKHERVLDWSVELVGPVWGGLDKDDKIRDEALLTGVYVDDWLFGTDDRDGYEVWYLSQLDEVWVYDSSGRANYRSNANLLYVERGIPAHKALLKVAGEPLARWPCPETPEELRTLCRMFYALQKGATHE